MPVGRDDPGRWRRRAVTLPGAFTLAALLVATLPLTLPLLALRDALARRRLAWTRALAYVAWYALCECAGITAALVAWLLRPVLGPSRYVAFHYAMQRAWIAALTGGMLRAFSMRLEVEGADATTEGPFLALVRHSSTADVLLPIAVIGIPRRMRPRYVLKAENRWDPCLDVVGHRLPNAFIRRGGGAQEAARVGGLADGLGPRDFVVIYPEGTRFSSGKLAARVAELAQRDDPLLPLARALTSTLPPRPGAVLELLERAAGVDVVFLAHVGLDGVRTFDDVFSGALIGARVQVGLWRIPARELPTDASDRVSWLFEQWVRVDQWVAARVRSTSPPR